ncbi:MAG: cysteine desulfurase family protein [Candidatus Aenigmatarchaeota archaeon]
MIYLDNTTTTKVDEKVAEIVKKHQLEYYGYATSDFSPSFNLKSREIIDDAKKVISEKIKCSPDEIFFTSGETESNNWVLRGIEKGHIITTKIEHSSILDTCKILESEGYEITYLDVNRYGLIDMNQLKNSIKKNTKLISIQHANQEVGVIQKIEEIGKICRKEKIPFHVDASHSFLKSEIDVKKFGIDFLTITSHLIHGPKGVGALYIRKGLKLKPLIYGTRILDIAGIAGFAEAVRIWEDGINKKTFNLKKKLMEGLKEIPNIVFFGDLKNSLPNILCFGVKFIEGESMVLYLEDEGIVLSTGSSCSGKGLRPSHVLKAMGFGVEANGSIRIGLSKYNTEEEIDLTVEKIKKVVEKLRKISPIKG